MTNNNTQNTNLLHRAFLFLEDKEWDKADEYAEKVLDGDPASSDAYLCKLLSELHVTRKELLSDVPAEISQSKNYINALKYADASQKKFLEGCAQKAHNLFTKQQRIESRQKLIDTFSGVIETYRDTQQSNRNMIKRGKSAARMYLITYVIFIILFATAITLAQIDEGLLTIAGMLGGIGVPVLVILLWVGHARLTRFWDLDYGDDRGWTFPYFFGMINALFTFGIWGLVKAFKTRKECKGLSDNIVEMERQIKDMQQKIEEEKAALAKEFDE